jgi:hypothetical protein
VGAAGDGKKHNGGEQVPRLSSPHEEIPVRAN